MHIPRRVNTHDIQATINLDDIIEYTANTHLFINVTHVDNKEEANVTDMLLCHMAGRSSNNTSPGDIRQVLAAKQGSSNKRKSVKVNEATTTPEIFTLGDTTYYLNKDETINFQGNQYSAHSTMVRYNVGQHEGFLRDKLLVDRGAIGGVCVMICLYQKVVNALLM